MAELKPVTRATYGSRRWMKSRSLAFARHDSIAPLGLSEIPKAITSTAVGFLTINNSMTPVALFGLLAGQNWYVTKDGKWLGEYLPNIYHCYPFQLIKGNNGESALYIDEQSGLLTGDVSADSEPFFDENNSPSTLIAQIMSQLNKNAEDLSRTQVISSILQKHELLEPWTIQVQIDDGVQQLQGLHRINEAKLNTLSAAALFELRNSNALMVAYGQLFSMQNLQKLGRLAATFNSSQNRPPASPMDVPVQADSGNISFDNL